MVENVEQRCCRSTFPTRSCRSSPSSAATAAAATARRAGRTASSCRCSASSRTRTTSTSCKEGRGRRLFPAAPEQSLLLLKATGTRAARRRQAARGRLRRLPAAPPLDRAGHALRQGQTDPAVARIEVFPPSSACWRRDSEQQIAVVAHYSDGSTEDVTPLRAVRSQRHRRWPRSTRAGLVTTGQLTGGVGGDGPLPGAGRRLPRDGAAGRAGRRRCRRPKNFVDELVVQEAARRSACRRRRCATTRRSSAASTIDICRPAADARRRPRRSWPTPTPTSASKLIDRLLDSTDYADYFANKWTRHPAQQAAARRLDSAATFAFHDWIRDSLHENKPYDQFVREDPRPPPGDVGSNPPVAWYREVDETNGPGRGHGPALPRPADSVRPLPSPSVREVEPARLLRLRGVLLRTSAASRRSSRAKTRICPPAAATAAATESQDRARREADRPRRPSRSSCPPTTTRGTRWPTGWPRRTTRSSPGRWSTATGSTSSAAAWSIPKTTCG